MRADRLLIMNIRARLAASGRLTDRTLALWCHHTPGWISKLLAGKHKKISFTELDRIADFFSIEVRDLFAPERRKSRAPYTGVERRSGKDRREH